MTRHLVVFIATFAIGALIAVVLRTGSHKPYEEHSGHPAPGAASAAPATAYEGANPHAGHQPAGTTASDDAGHAGHGASPAAPAEHQGHASTAKPSVRSAAPAPASADHATHQAPTADAPATGAAVNTLCALCGMPVDPKLGTIAYKGKLIGFGCRACPAKFRADPAKYGEAALSNQVVE